MSDEVPQDPLEVAPERAAELAAEGAQLIDVRTDEEWAGARIPGARHIELGELSARAEEIDRDAPVVFYCRGGSRSRMAAEAFSQAGYEAFNLSGGIVAWTEGDRPTEPEGATVAHGAG